MSDLFHKEVPLWFIDCVFDTMEAADWHVFQVLTKRSSLMVRYLRRRYGVGSAPPHIWLGVSIEDARNAVRLNHLRSAQAATKFVSFEPLLGPVGDLDLDGIAWAIVGGESGPRARPMLEEWAIEIRDQCRDSKVAFFFKQWGGVRPKSGGRRLQGREWNQYPRVATRPSFGNGCRALVTETQGDPYTGREQTQAKHYILKRYLQALAFKVLTFNDITYVDGFSGPWKTETEDFSDSSFMIAIRTLLDVQEQIQQRTGTRRNVRCFFSEENPKTFRNLESAVTQFHAPERGFEIKTYSGKFERCD